MKKFTSLKILLILFIFTTVCAQSQILYVNVNATGTNNGTSFANGYNHLNTALANASAGNEIRIAQGIYYPDLGTGVTAGDRNATFTIPDGVTLLGGYNPSTGIRNIHNYIVRLSGEIQQNGVETDNSIHIITIEAITATIDGITIEKGYADASFPDSEGGGFYINAFSGYNLTINQCNFENNYAQSGGAAIRIPNNTYSSAGVISIDNSTFTSNNSFNGGAVKLSGNATLSNTTFNSNTARFGGALYVDGGFTTITNTMFTNNSIASSGNGGAVYTRLKSNNFARFVGCTFNDNAAPGREGGAITIESATGAGYNKGIAVENCSFNRNTAQFGAAIRAEGVNEISIIDSTFDDNTAGSSGAGFGIYGNPTGAKPFISGCTFTNNSASGAGGNGIYFQSAGGLIEDCVFENNGLGAGFDSTIAFFSSSATLNRCIINNNNAGRIIRVTGSGSPTISNSLITNNSGRFIEGEDTSTLRIENNTIANNGTGIRSLESNTMLVYNNIFWGNTSNIDANFNGTVDFNIMEGGYALGTSISTADPMFVNEAGDNYRLQSGSPGINTGNNAYASTPRDLDGNIRVENGQVDMGAYEFGAGDCPIITDGIIYVDVSNTNNFELGNSWEFAFTSFQEALVFHQSACGPVTEIRVAAGTYFPDDSTVHNSGDRTASFVLPTDLTYLGGFPPGGGDLATRDFIANPSILSGDINTLGNNSDNTYNLIITQNVSTNTIIDGFTIEKGIASQITPTGQNGGAWRNVVDGAGNSSEPNVRNCIIKDNSAITNGGAIYNQGINGGTATMNFTNCQFINNSTTSTANGFGGAIFNNNTTNGTAVVTLTNCYFEGNNARYGGAIRSIGRDGGSGFISMEVINTIFYQNSANSVGGVFLFDIDNTSNDYQFTNCTFYGNSSASSDGSGLDQAQSNINVGVINSIFWANTGNGTTLNNQISGFSVSETYCNIQGFTGTFNNNSGANPLLVDGPNGNLRLQVTSPAINTGFTSANTEPNDIEGNARVIGPQIDRGAYESTAGVPPRIEIEGNTTGIVNGDITPDTVDDTDFETVLATETLTKTFTIFNNGGAILNLTENTLGTGDFITVTGAAEFTVTSQPSATISSAGSSSFQITFTPDCTTLGIRTATISVSSDDITNSPYTFNVQAMTDETAAPEITCPVAITIFTDAGLCTSTQAIGMPTTNGCGIVTNNAPASLPIGITTVTWTIDNNGNIATCDQEVTVLDQEDPVITCPANITVNNDPGVCGAIVTFTAPFGNDNCMGVTTTQIQGNASGEMFDIGTTTNVFEVTDASGNTTTCSFTVTVNDTEAPVINCENITVSLNQSGLINFNPSALFSGYNISQSGTFTPIDISGTGTSVTLGDDDFSSAFPINFSFEYFGSPKTQFYISSNGFITFQNEEYSEQYIAFSNTDLDPSEGGTIMYHTVGTAPNRILVVDFTDVPYYGSLNPDVTTQLQLFETTNSIEIHSLKINEPEDDVNTQGVFSDFSDVTVPGRDNQVWSAMNDFVSFTPTNSIVNDNCGIDYFEISPAFLDCSNIGVNTINVSVFDESGNESTCTFEVTVVDDTAPLIECTNATLALDGEGVVTLTEADVLLPQTTNYLFSNAGTFAPQDILATGTTVPMENNEVTGSLPIGFDFSFYGSSYSNFYISSNGFITFNNSGNEGCCSGPLLPNANDPNNIIALAWTFLSIEESGVITFETIGTAPNRTLIIDFTDVAVLGSGANDVTSQIKLFEGSNTIEIHSENIIMSPFIPMTQGIENADGSLAVTVPGRNSEFWSATDDFVSFTPNGGLAFDNCGLATTVIEPSSFDCTQLGENTVTITSTDTSGNISTCTSIVTIIDNLPPVIVCQDFTAQLDENGIVTIVGTDLDGGTTDNCDYTLSVSPNTFDCDDVGSTIAVILTATDSSGNMSTCAANVLVEDNVTPTALCQDITIQLDATGNASILVTDVDGGSSDACGIATTAIDVDTFDCSNVGLNSVTLTVTDVNGNSSNCVAVVTVEDNITPTVTCVPNATRDADSGGCDYTVVGSEFDAIFDDNCSDVFVTNDYNGTDTLLGDILPLGDTTVIWTADDNNGQTTTCSTLITVVDNTNPIAICQNITIQLDATGNASIEAADVDGGSNDTCGIDTLSVDIASFDCSNLGANNIMLTVTDNAGNTDSCVAVVTVEDNVPPVALCQNITVQLDNTGNASIVATDVDGGSSDACGIASTLIDITEFDCSNVGDNNITLTVTDVNGNTSTCIAIVTVEDTIDPQMNCPADFTVGTDSEVCGAIVNFTTPISVDTCGIASVIQTSGLPSGSFFSVGPNIVEYTATDENGNTTSCSFTITVEDDEAPIAVCQDITIQLDAAGNATIAAGTIDSGSTDNCGIDTLSIDIDTFTCAEIGDNMVTLTVTDTAGLTSSCTATVTVEDITPPVTVCQDITVNLDATGTVTIDPALLDGGSTDACGTGILTYSATPDTFTCAEVGDNSVILTVTDENGNSATCEATVTVMDDTAPILVCQDITVSLDINGLASIVPTNVIASLDDACGIDATEVDIDDFSCDDLGTSILVTVFANDVNGNIVTCTATVTVVDELEPQFDIGTLPEDQVRVADENGEYILEDFTSDVVVTDNCSILDAVIVLGQNPVAGTVLTVGVYNITLNAADDFGNLVEYVFELEVVAPLGIGENKFDIASVTMYPNPASEYVVLSNPQNIPLKDISIYDVTGRLIQKVDASKATSEVKLDIAKLASATYMILINTEAGQINKQLVKE